MDYLLMTGIRYMPARNDLVVKDIPRNKAIFCETKLLVGKKEI